MIVYQNSLTELVAGIVTLFVILDPIGVLPFFMTLTHSATEEQRNKLARRAVLIAAGLLFAFTFLGDGILLFLGIQIADFQIAGGALLLIFAIRDALSNEPLGMSESSAAKDSVKLLNTLAVIPIATPLMAGPGSLTTVMLLAKEQFPLGLLISSIAIIVDCTIGWVIFRFGNRITKAAGPTVLLIIGKVMDILMAAIAVSFLTAGITAIFS